MSVATRAAIGPQCAARALNGLGPAVVVDVLKPRAILNGIARANSTDRAMMVRGRG